MSLSVPIGIGSGLQLRAAVIAVAAAAIILTALVLGATAWTNADVSCLISMSERWLDGERPYIDFIEINPPASILAYLPAVFAARRFGISPEAAVSGFMVAFAAVNLVFAGRILRQAKLLFPTHWTPMVLAALILFLLVPTGTFAEREHIAAVAILPLLAVLIVRTEAGEISRATAALAGLSGSLALIIKPMFVLALVGPCLVLLSRRGWRSAAGCAEVYVAAAVSLAYGLCVLVFFPTFVHDSLDLVLQSYVPVRHTVSELALSPLTVTWIALAVILKLVANGRLGTASLIVALASAGFHAVLFEQGKNWPYHALPSILLMVLAILLQIERTTAVTRRAGLCVAATAICVAFAAQQFQFRSPIGTDMPDFVSEVERVGPHPRLMAIASDIAIGHPLVRQVGGRWVGQLYDEWLTKGLLVQQAQGVSGERLRQLQANSAREKEIVARDLRDGMPDVLLIQDGWLEYAQSTPALRSALSSYRPIRQYGTFAFWRRNDAAEKDHEARP